MKNLQIKKKILELHMKNYMYSKNLKMIKYNNQKMIINCKKIKLKIYKYKTIK